MHKKKEDSTPKRSAYSSEKTETKEFFQNIHRLTEIGQARFIGQLEGGVAMWEMLNAETLQK